MKKLWLGLFICGLMMVGASQASAALYEYNFYPNPTDIGDLTHQYYYGWRVSWDLPNNEHITKAQLSIKSINDWMVEDGDILYVDLLDDLNTSGGVRLTTGGNVWSWVDNEAAGDAFAGKGTPLTTYSDYGPNPEDWSYSLTGSQISILESYINSSNNFAFGLDPDCHYYNCGLNFKITTGVIPEPASMALFGIGLAGLARRLRRRV